LPWDLLVGGVPPPPNELERWQTYKALGLGESMPHCEELDMLLATLTRVMDAPYGSVALYYNR
jgi:hypothetical protein